MKALRKYLLLLGVIPWLALSVEVKNDAPEVYVVKEGDTLWDISSLYLLQPWLWPELWRNNSHIQNPHLIFPGDQLRLTYDASGNPQLSLGRSDKKVLKLSPTAKRQPKQQDAVPVIPWSVISPILEQGLVIEQATFDALPKLLGDYDKNGSFATGDLVIGQSKGTNEEKYLVLRRQNDLFDMQDNLLGFQVRYVADAEAIGKQPKGQNIVRISASNFEAVQGDRLAPTHFLENAEQLQLQPAEGVQGHIIANLREHRLMGKYDVVALDLGKTKNLQPGTVMGIYQRGPAIDGDNKPEYVDTSGWFSQAFNDESVHQAPPLKVGELVVFKTFDKVSYGLILRASKMVERGNIVARP
ncbi:LysM domain-containing protein [Aliiglaciecola sp. CAU 1673]|uniref:LysM peptidoglycan-binding domain-containing protein n=1 Tax=Aliiglaciecola sp. CAU 1673 TaxID=3032595 RepID=UPI0023DC44B7|nr:LysM domain-containing protein [Aliiglaciecola sp. CAU 1673]MDF2179755.1 LysM domain-containing protein [Aliiglaciecola sp. CAU 1673]